MVFSDIDNLHVAVAVYPDEKRARRVDRTGPVVVLADQVTTYEPLAAKGGSGLLHVLPVSERPRVAPHPQGSYISALDLLALLVTDANLEPIHRSSKGSRSHRSRQIADENVPHLGSAQAIQELYPEGLFPLVIQRYWQSLSRWSRSRSKPAIGASSARSLQG